MQVPQVVDARELVGFMFPHIGMPQGGEWFIILAIVILVFGAAKLPALARSTGQALRIFKSETKGLVDDDQPDELPPSSSTSEAQAQQQPETKPSGTDAN